MGFVKYFRIALIFVIIYLFIFNPPIKFLPNLIWLSLPFIYAYIIYHSLIGKLVYLFKNEIIIIFLLALYTIFRNLDWSSGQLDKAFVYGNVSMLTEMLPFGMVIIDLCHRKLMPYKQSGDDKLIDMIVLTCIVASLITILLIVFPSFNSKMNDKILDAGDYQKVNILRGFGFAASLTYAYGIVQGIAAAIVLLKMSTGRRYFLLFFVAFVMLLISILVNARIGMVPIVVMILYLIFVKRRIKIFIYGSIMFGLLVWAFLSTSYAEKYSQTIEWAMGFFLQTIGFVSGSKSGQHSNTYEVLLNSMVVLPDTVMGWLIGSGSDLVIGGKGSPVVGTVGHSDVGFIRQLYFGGLIYLGLIILFISSTSIRLYKLKKDKWFFALFVFTIVLGNIKGYFVANQPALRLLILIYMGFIYCAFKQRSDKSTISQNTFEIKSNG